MFVEGEQRKVTDLNFEKTGELFRLCPLQIQSFKSGSAFVVHFRANSTASSHMNSFYKLTTSLSLLDMYSGVAQ